MLTVPIEVWLSTSLPINKSMGCGLFLHCSWLAMAPGGYQLCIMLRFAFHSPFKSICPNLGPLSACCCLIWDHFKNNVYTISTFTSNQWFWDRTSSIWPWFMIVFFTWQSRVSGICPQWLPDVPAHFLLIPAFSPLFPVQDTRRKGHRCIQNNEALPAM